MHTCSCYPRELFALSLNLEVAPCILAVCIPCIPQGILRYAHMQLLRRCAHVYRSVQVEPILGMELFRRCTDVFRYKTSETSTEIADNCCSRVVVCMTPLLLGCHPHLAPIAALVSARCAAAAAAAAAAANGVYPSTTELL